MNNNPSSNNQNQKNQNQNQNQQNNKNINASKEAPQSMDRNDKRFWSIVAAVIIVGAVVVFGIHYSANAPGTSSSDDTTADASSTSSMIAEPTDDANASAASSQTYTYSCDNEKTIAATFHLPQDDFANVNLSDGRHLILAHTISADGARYANANESVVFWTKGVTAFVTDNGTSTYSGCVANRFP